MNILVIGASSGIGREVVKKFSETAGNKVIALARNEKALKGLSDNSEGRNVIAIPFDITEVRTAPNELKERVRDHLESIDILVNCAGYLVNKPFADHTKQDIDSIIGVNFTGIAIATSELIPLLSKTAHVINISSMGGFQGSLKFPGLSYYSAAKGALAILTECLAAEYADSGISFNCLCLGGVETDMFRKAFPGQKAPVTPEDMADFIVDFALTGNKFFNGKILPVAVSVP